VTEPLTTSPARTSVLSEFADVRLGIVCPMANEAATAVAFVDAVLAECHRYPFRSVQLFVVVDTVSRDQTRGLLEGHQESCSQLRVVWAPENQGVADAYVRGYREALAEGSDWILEIDAGFSHSPADIGTFVETMVSSAVDCVFGSRFISGGANHGTLRRRLISRAGTALTNTLLGTRLSDMTSGFQLFSRAALEGVLANGIRAKGPFFQTEMKTSCRRLRVAEIPIEYSAGSHRVGQRAITESLITLFRLFRRRLAREL
jgi:dolichol-phosphate mannosyltransferase